MKKALLFLGLLNAWQVHASPNNPAAPIVGDFSASSTVVCVGQLVHFTDLSTPDPINWSWSFSGGTPSASSIQNPIVTYNVPGTYTVILKVSNSAGTATIVKTDFIKVVAPPNAKFDSSGISCEATNTFNFTPVDVGSHTWIFSGGTPATSSDANPTGIKFTGLGLHTVTHILFSPEGCSATASGHVEITPDITSVSVTGGTSNCALSEGTITINTVNGGTPPYIYSLNGGPFTGDNPITGLAPGNYLFTIKDSKGCVLAGSTPVVNVSSTGGPVSATVTTVPATCGNNNGKATVGPVTGGVGPYHYMFDGQTSFGTSNVFNAYAPGSHSVVIKDQNGCLFTKNFTITATSITNFTLSPTASGCSSHNGTIGVSGIIGGVAPFSYSLDGVTFIMSSTFTGLAAGSYTVTVKDATGCSLSKPVTVTNATGPNLIGISTTASKCNSSTGKITIGISSGGTPPYTYSVDGSAFTSTTIYNSVGAGSHTVVIKDANGCTLSNTVTIPTTAPPTAITATAGPASCSTGLGNILLGTVTGGTSPYTYSVDNSAFTNNFNYPNKGVGSHSIVVKDNNGCTFSRSIDMVLATPPTKIAFTTVPTGCSANTGTLALGTVTGGVPIYTYSVAGSSFSTNLNYNNLAAGTVSIVVKDGKGCELDTSATIGVSTPTDFTFSSTLSHCNAATGSVTVNTVTGGTGSYSYSADGGIFSTNTTLGGLAPGNHTITVKDASGCTITKTITINVTSGPTGLATSSTSTDCNQSEGTVAIGEVTGGTPPYLFSFNNGVFTPDTLYTGLTADAYPLVVQDNNGCTFTTVATVNSNNGPEIILVSTTNPPCSSNGSLTVDSIAGGSPLYSFAIDNGAFGSSNTFTGIAPGIHAVKVKDSNGCIGALTVVFEDLRGPSDFTFTTTNSDCNNTNGSVVFGDITGGQAPYQYTVDAGTFSTNNNIQHLNFGTHTFRVEDVNGCVLSKTANIGHTEAPVSATSAQINPDCGQNNGKITITNVTGGVPPYHYVCSLFGQPNLSSNTPEFKNLEAGLYSVSISGSNGCGINLVVLLASSSGPTSINSSNTNSTCEQANGIVHFASTTGGSGPYQYSLNGSAFSSNSTYIHQPPGAQPVKVKDVNGCTYSSMTIVLNTGEVPPTPTITQAGFILTSNATTGNQWFMNGTAIGGATNQSFTVLVNGSYTVTVNNGVCTSAPSAPVVITNRMFVINQGQEEEGNTAGASLTNEEESNNIMNVRVFPNPNNGYFTISFNVWVKNNYTVQLFNALGKMVYTESLNNFDGTYSKMLQLPNPGKGIYSLVVIGGGSKTVKKVVID